MRGFDCLERNRVCGATGERVMWKLAEVVEDSGGRDAPEVYGHSQKAVGRSWLRPVLKTLRTPLTITGLTICRRRNISCMTDCEYLFAHMRSTML